MVVDLASKNLAQGLYKEMKNKKHANYMILFTSL